MKISEQCTNIGCRSNAIEKFSDGRQICNSCFLKSKQIDKNNNFICKTCDRKTKIKKDEIPKCKNNDCNKNNKKPLIISLSIFILLLIGASLSDNKKNNSKNLVQTKEITKETQNTKSYWDAIPHRDFNEWKKDMDDQLWVYLNILDKQNNNQGQGFRYYGAELKYVKVGVSCRFLFDKVENYMDFDGITQSEIIDYQNNKTLCLRNTTWQQNITYSDVNHIFASLDATLKQAITTTNILKNHNLIKHYYRNMDKTNREIIEKKLKTIKYRR